MNITQEYKEGVTILNLNGDLGHPSAVQLEKLVMELVELKRNLIIMDLENIEFIDSQAMLLLLRINREVLASGGSVKLLRPRKVVQRFMSIGKVFELFERFETKIEAINSFNTAQGKSDPVIDDFTAKCRKQRSVIMRLMEMLVEKEVVDMEQFHEIYSLSSQLVLDQYRRHYSQFPAASPMPRPQRQPRPQYPSDPIDRKI